MRLKGKLGGEMVENPFGKERRHRLGQHPKKANEWEEGSEANAKNWHQTRETYNWWGEMGGEVAWGKGRLKWLENGGQGHGTHMQCALKL